MQSTLHFHPAALTTSSNSRLISAPLSLSRLLVRRSLVVLNRRRHNGCHSCRRVITRALHRRRLTCTRVAAGCREVFSVTFSSISSGGPVVQKQKKQQHPRNTQQQEQQQQVLLRKCIQASRRLLGALAAARRRCDRLSGSSQEQQQSAVSETAS